MKILTLNLNKEYFDEILSGNKKEEYREVKEYWTKRLKQKYDRIVSEPLTTLRSGSFLGSS